MERSSHAAMVNACTSRSARDLLLRMLAEEIETRVRTINALVKNGDHENGSMRENIASRSPVKPKPPDPFPDHGPAHRS
jgi:hypothetical protein